jgi:hypothetical protein
MNFVVCSERLPPVLFLGTYPMYMYFSCIYYAYERVKFIKNSKKLHIFFNHVLSLYKILS